MTKLTHDLLIEIGFRGEGKSFTNKPLYRLKPLKNKIFGYYHFEIQMQLGDYPETNGNSGILSLYSKPIKDAHMLVEEYDSNDKADFAMWEDKENGLKGGIKYIDIKEFNQPIAWHVTTLERLNELYCALTQNEPLKSWKNSNNEI